MPLATPQMLLDLKHYNQLDEQCQQKFLYIVDEGSQDLYEEVSEEILESIKNEATNSLAVQRFNLKELIGTVWEMYIRGSVYDLQAKKELDGTDEGDDISSDMETLYYRIIKTVLVNAGADKTLMDSLDN
jgi:hypothetical protein